jgi:hypothetical protein
VHALDYARSCRSSPDKREMIHGLRRSANALIRVGDHSEAQNLLLEAIDYTTQRKLTAQTFACSDLLASSYLQMGDVEQAAREISRQSALVADAASDVQRAMLHYSRCQLAWLTSDHRSARTLVSDAPQIPSQWLVASKFCSGIGTIAARLLNEPRSVNGDEVQQMYLFYLRGRSLGRQDINTSILCIALATVGREADAARLKSEYSYIRREMKTLPRFEDCKGSPVAARN